MLRRPNVPSIPASWENGVASERMIIQSIMARQHFASLFSARYLHRYILARSLLKPNKFRFALSLDGVQGIWLARGRIGIELPGANNERTRHGQPHERYTQ